MKKTKPYSDYSDFDQVWLGKLPSHWKVMRTKLLFDLITEPAPVGNSEELLSVYTALGVKPRKELEARGNKASSTDNYWRVKKGDIIVNKLLAWMGAIGISEYNGVTSPAYDILRPKENVDPYFYNYLFRNTIASKEFKRHSRGIMDMRLRLYFSRFGDVKLPFPNINEQHKIVEFIQFKTEKINRFITKKKQLIELLTEQKAAIINQAVTKGLDPNTKLKPSGIKWLGDIPEHWEVRKLKFLAKIKTGRTPKIESSSIDYFKNGSINWYTPGDFGDEGFLSTAKRTVHNEAIQNNQIEIFPSNTVYLIGIGGTIGKVGFCENEGSSNQQINAIIFNDQIISKFGFYSLKCAKHQIDLLADFTTLPILNQSKTKEILIPHTRNQDEQKEIIHHIETETSKIDKTISTIEKEITLVEEYKTALIAEAVTGKIDVRGFKIPEIEEPMAMVAEEASNYNKANNG